MKKPIAIILAAIINYDVRTVRVRQHRYGFV